jgi:hypothetical protein
MRGARTILEERRPPEPHPMRRYRASLPRVPTPYTMLRRRARDEASGKYRGREPRHRRCGTRRPGLGDELGIECEVVRVLLEGSCLEDAPRVHAEAGVKAPRFWPRATISTAVRTVCEVLHGRHPTRQRLPPASNARAENDVADVEVDEPDEQRNEPDVVLAVGVDHCDNVARALACRTIARPLIPTVTAIAPVLDDREPKPSRELDRPIAARNIDQDDLAHDIVRHVTPGPQSPRRAGAPRCSPFPWTGACVTR